MDLLADIDPVNAVLVVHLRHGYGVDTTHHTTHSKSNKISATVSIPSHWIQVALPSKS